MRARVQFMRGRFDREMLELREQQLQGYFDELLTHGLDDMPECLKFFVD